MKNYMTGLVWREVTVQYCVDLQGHMKAVYDSERWTVICLYHMSHNRAVTVLFASESQRCRCCSILCRLSWSLVKKAASGPALSPYFDHDSSSPCPPLCIAILLNLQSFLLFILFIILHLLVFIFAFSNSLCSSSLLLILHLLALTLHFPPSIPPLNAHS